ncbi:MAG TPA: hypothetical protein VFJ85_01635 [Acidimicrobiales bacterium]|nr:hypothetical protein [Acidimicrobiales bacterium]
MSRRDSLVLKAFSAWVVFIWAFRLPNVFKDHQPGHGFGFKAVHVVIAAVSVAFAVACWKIAARSTKREPADSNS